MKHVFWFATFLLGSIAFAQVADTLDLSEHKNVTVLNRKKIDETSALVYIKDFLYTINDSGGKPELYKLNPKTGEVVQTIQVKNADNVDWEALTTDGKYLFIGDFGNNLGNRKDQIIYKFKIDRIKSINDTLATVKAETIKFFLDNQTIFEEKNRNHDFDIESMVFYDGKLHLFTKEWISGKTTHHTLETYYKFQYSVVIEDFTIGGLVTDATIKEGELRLLGYSKEGLAFMWKFSQFSDRKFFNGNSQKTVLGLTPSISQVEGITFGNNGVYISGEYINFAGVQSEPKLYFIED